MKKVSDFKEKIQFLFTDIDDTLTDEGRLGSRAYRALWDLYEAGIHIIPVTGRPAGWCEMIARVWPVTAIVGENGGFYFRYQDKVMKRHFAFDERTQALHRLQLKKIEEEVLRTVPGCALASDQFCRLMDLAIDFCEDVPRLTESSVQEIVKVFEKHGAQAKVSSIHVNGWFGQYNKLSMVQEFLKKEFQILPDQALRVSAFCGDSPNDEPMFQFFTHSFGVANIVNFQSQIQHLPRYVSELRGGAGFAEIAQQILSST